MGFSGGFSSKTHWVLGYVPWCSNPGSVPEIAGQKLIFFYVDFIIHYFIMLKK